MQISEAARADLYTGLAEAIGPDRAETLMAQLPRFDPDQVALKSDVAEFRAEFKAEMAEFRAEIREGLAAVNQRMDRLFLTMLVGMFGIVATMLGVILSIR
jgi:hypothetical protein